MTDQTNLTVAKPAGFWRRLAALMIDGLIFAPVLFGIAYVLGFGTLLSQIISAVLVVAYYTYLTSSPWQATLGKRIMKVYIVRADSSGSISRVQAFIRYMVLYGVALASGFVAVMDANTMRMQEIVMSEQLTAEQEVFLSEVQAGNIPANPLLVLLKFLSFLWSIVIAAMVAFTRAKTGPHDLICKTRALVGRPGIHSPLPA